MKGLGSLKKRASSGSYIMYIYICIYFHINVFFWEYEGASGSLSGLFAVILLKSFGVLQKVSKDQVFQDLFDNCRAPKAKLSNQYA